MARLALAAPTFDDRPLARESVGDLRESVGDLREDVFARGAIVTYGPRVALRTLTPGDLAHLARWAEDPALEEMVGSEFLDTFKNVWDTRPEFYDACLEDPTQIVLMVVPRRGNGVPVGVVRLFNIHMVEGYAFLETIIGDRTAIRRGLGVEAGKLISYYGLDVLGLRRIEAKVYDFNLLSRNSLRRNGFHQEGVLRQAGVYQGRPCDVLVFGILRHEIEAERDKDRRNWT